jgi:hypothetical protein
MRSTSGPESQTGLFEAHGDEFVPTGLTRGGWSDNAQHGGPPAGLLARSIERHPSDVPMAVVRLTFDLLRPVPLEPLRARSRLIRGGRRVQLAEATLEASGTEVARATGLRIRTTQLELPELPEAVWDAPPGPEAGSPPDWSAWGRTGLDTPTFHRDGIEIRSIGGSFEQAGPGLAWFRLRHPLIAGEEDTYVVRIATIADMANGASATMDPREYLWINPDITLYLHRPTTSEWIGLRSVAYQRSEGLGVVDSLAFDEDGPLGRIVQAQLIDRHG